MRRKPRSFISLNRTKRPFLSLYHERSLFFKHFSVILGFTLIFYLIFPLIKPRGRCRIIQKNRPDISFVIPMFNKGHYIPRCLDSIISQNVIFYEVICMDDCSTDNSTQVVDKYTGIDDRIQLFKMEKNSGVFLARVAAIEKSKGEYIFSIDPDDALVQNSVSQLYEYTTSKSFDIIAYKVVSVDANGVPHRIQNEWGVQKRFLNHDQMIDQFWKCNFTWNVCLKIIKRSTYMKAIDLLHEKFFIRITYGEDLLQFGTILLFAHNYSFFNQPVYYYFSNLPDNSNNQTYKETYNTSESKKLIFTFLAIQHKRKLKICI